MQDPLFKILPETNRGVHGHVSANVDVFHFLALVCPSEIDNVEVLEVSADVVCEIDAIFWEAAS